MFIKTVKMKKKQTIKIPRINPGFTIYRFIILCIGLLVFFFNDYAGFAIIILASIVSLTSAGWEIEGTTSLIRSYRALGPVTIGKWYSLPKIEYIAVVRMIQGKKTFHASSVSIVHVPTDEYTYHLNLVINPHKNDVIKLTAGSMDRMVELAIVLGKQMNLKVLDFTTPQHKWIL